MVNWVPWAWVRSAQSLMVDVQAAARLRLARPAYRAPVGDRSDSRLWGPVFSIGSIPPLI